MELNLSFTLTDWKDPMMAQLFDYVQHIEQVPDIYGIQDMDTLFTFLQSRMEEFMKSNPGYRKPAGLELCYCRPSCCPPTIRVAYLDQKFTIKLKPLNHENNPGKSINAIALSTNDELISPEIPATAQGQDVPGLGTGA